MRNARLTLFLEQVRQTWAALVVTMIALASFSMWGSTVPNFVRTVFFDKETAAMGAWAIAGIGFLLMFMYEDRRGLRLGMPRSWHTLPVPTHTLIFVQMAHKVLTGIVLTTITAWSTVHVFRVEYPFNPYVVFGAVMLAAGVWGLAWSGLVQSRGGGPGTAVFIGLMLGTAGGCAMLYWCLLSVSHIYPRVFSPFWSGHAPTPVVAEWVVLGLVGAGMCWVLICEFGSLWGMFISLTVLLAAGNLVPWEDELWKYESTGTDSLMAVVTLELVTMAGYALTWAAVNEARHGIAGPGIARLALLWPGGGGSSILRTQIWFEWRNAMAWLPVATLVLTLPLVIILTLAILGVKLFQNSLPLTFAPLVICATSLGTGYYLLRCSPEYLGFVGIRPMALRTMIRAKFAAALFGLLLTYTAIVTVFLPLLVFLLGYLHVSVQNVVVGIMIWNLIIALPAAWVALFLGRVLAVYLVAFSIPWVLAVIVAGEDSALTAAVIVAGGIVAAASLGAMAVSLNRNGLFSRRSALVLVLVMLLVYWAAVGLIPYDTLFEFSRILPDFLAVLALCLIPFFYVPWVLHRQRHQ